MASPKHLWSGDWQAESAAARRARAGSSIAAAEPAAAPTGETAAGAGTPARASLLARAAALRRRAAALRARSKLAVAAVLALAVLAAVAVALLAPGGSPPAHRASAPLAQALPGSPPPPSPFPVPTPAPPGLGQGIPGGGQAVPGAGVAGSAWLGVGVQASGSGVLITGIVAGGPADAAALRPGDLLESIGSQPVRSLQDLSAVLSALRPGETVWVRVRRGSATIATQLTLGQNPGDSSR